MPAAEVGNNGDEGDVEVGGEGMELGTVWGGVGEVDWGGEEGMADGVRGVVC